MDPFKFIIRQQGEIDALRLFVLALEATHPDRKALRAAFARLVEAETANLLQQKTPDGHILGMQDMASLLQSEPDRPASPSASP